jgi:hypothetical protein
MPMTVEVRDHNWPEGHLLEVPGLGACANFQSKELEPHQVEEFARFGGPNGAQDIHITANKIVIERNAPPTKKELREQTAAEKAAEKEAAAAAAKAEQEAAEASAAAQAALNPTPEGKP